MQLPLRKLTLLAFTFCVASPAWAAESAAPAALDTCNVVFTTPSADASGAVPLGNGSLGVSVWLEPSGDLVFYLNHTDSFSEASRLLKLGKVRVRFEPSLLPPGSGFRQELKLRQGRLELNLGASVVNLLVEPGRPVLRVLGRFAAPTTVRVLNEGWRKTPLALGPGHALESANARVDKGEIGSAAWSLEGAPADWAVVESADVALTVAQAPAAIGWYHRNATSPVARTLKQQGLAGLHGSFDPLLGRTFGAWIDAPGLTRTAEGTLQSPQPATQLDLRVTCPVLITARAEEWVATARTTAAAATTPEAARVATERHWADFWARSWIFVNGDAASPVPDNHHPVRIGVDSEGGSLFPGALGRVGLYDHVLSSAELAQLAAGSPQAPTAAPLPGRLLELAAPSPGSTPPELTQLPLANGLTWEAWIRPDENKAGRILDRMTAGKNDGVLFDTWPGDALRLIVGQRTLSAKGVVRAGVWQHVAATYEPATGATALYLGGKEVAHQTGDTNPLSRGYNLHRYTIACQARGEFAPKFNGGIFTVEPGFADEKNKALSPDWRRWGDSYWFQNTRLIYHPMIMAGDFDLMEPFWKLYSRPRQLAEARSTAWYQSQGSWIPETMTLFGTYANKDYGWNRDGKVPGQVASPWWHWAWNQTPELIDLLLKRYEWTLDADFAHRELLPQAESLLRYFDTRFRRDDRGILVIDPTQSAETYWNGVVNDLPNIAGLRCILPRLRALPTALTSPVQRALFDRLWAACPEIPVGDRGTKDGVRRVLLPAWKFEEKTNNCENTEQYAIWPFGNYAVGKPDLLLGHTTYHVRKFDLPVGWGYDGNAVSIRAAEERRVALLKARGFNAVRLSHNPPSELFLDACDKLGLLVIDEAFDMWRESKNPDDYHLDFATNWENDIDAMVLRSRNRPSIIAWSIGNEIPERFTERGVLTAKSIAGRIRALDPTRPVTQGLNGEWKEDVEQAVADQLDIVGYNYQLQRYGKDHINDPKRVIYASESFPLYAAEHWFGVLDHDHVIGDFVWTAMDYLGEAGCGFNLPKGPAPFYQMQPFPMYTGNTGDLDLCGFQRPQSLFRDVLWDVRPAAIVVDRPRPAGESSNPNPWGWPDVEARWNWTVPEGTPLKVQVYAKGEKVELYQDGKLMGSAPAGREQKHTANFTVPWRPGTLKAVVYRNGFAAETTLSSAGPAVALRLTPERTQLGATRDELAYVKVEVVDAQGRVVPDAVVPVDFAVSGAARLRATGNGNASDPASFTAPTRRTFNGQALVILQPTGPGSLDLKATAPGLTPAVLKLNAR